MSMSRPFFQHSRPATWDVHSKDLHLFEVSGRGRDGIFDDRRRQCSDGRTAAAGIEAD
jgi:hypothetical protein